MSAIKSTIALACLALLAGQAGATGQPRTGGSVGVERGRGFACADGNGWVMRDGVAVCGVPSAPSPMMASCSAVASVPGVGACRHDLPAAGHGVTVAAPNKTPGYMGTLSITCNNGAWGTPTASCQAGPTLAISQGPSPVVQGNTYTFSWTTTDAVGGTLNCSGANPLSASIEPTSSRSLTAMNIGTTTCSLVMTGPGGTTPMQTFTWESRGAADCPAETIASGSCSYTLPITPSGQTAVAATSTTGYSGSVSASCSDGVWTYGASTCSQVAPPPPPPPAPPPPAPTNCDAQVMTYTRLGTTCEFPIAPLTHGGQSGLVLSNTANTLGSAMASCTNGTLNFVSEPSCIPNNASAITETVFWQSVGSCNATQEGGYEQASSFQAYLLKTDSTFWTSNSQSGPWTYTGRNFTSVQAAIDSDPGQERIVEVNTTINGRDYYCESWRDPLYPTITGPYCPSAVITSGTCTYVTPDLPYGLHFNVTNNSAQYSGNARATCSAGVWSLSNESCVAAALPPPPPQSRPTDTYIYACWDTGTLLGYSTAASCATLDLGYPNQQRTYSGSGLLESYHRDNVPLTQTTRTSVLCGSGYSGDGAIATPQCPSNGGRGGSSRDSYFDVPTRKMVFGGGGGGGGS